MDAVVNAGVGDLTPFAWTEDAKPSIVEPGCVIWVVGVGAVDEGVGVDDG